MTNVLLVVLVSDKASMYVPKSFSEQLGSFEGKVIASSSINRWSNHVTYLDCSAIQFNESFS